MKTIIFALIGVILIAIKLIACSEGIETTINTPPTETNNSKVTITDASGDPTNIAGSITVTAGSDINNLTVSPSSFNATATFSDNTLTIEITTPSIITVTIKDIETIDIIEVNSTLTIDDSSGNVIMTKAVNNPDGSLTETEIDANGNETLETVTVNNPDGSVTKTITEPNGEVTVIESVSNPDGTTTETTTNPNGSIVRSIIDVDEQKYSCTDTTYIPIITADTFQNMALDKNYCPGKDIDLSSITNFAPIGSSSNPFTGNIDGNNKTISGLTINNTTTNYIGLFAKIGSGGTVKNLIVENPIVIGQSYVGALAGQNDGTIDNVEIKGATEGTEYMVKGTAGITGGLVGKNQGIIKNSHSEGRVDGKGGSTGGLAGLNFNEDTNDKATIENSYALGYVSGERWTGGLAGENQGNIIDSYAGVETVSTSYSIGGLIGRNGNDTDIQGAAASITKSYATGNVQATSHNWIGGLVGSNYATITNSHSEGEVSGGSAIGGLAGWNGTKNTTAKATIENSYSTGKVTKTGSDSGGLLGSNGGGSGYSAGTITNSYFDTHSTEQTNGIGYNKDSSQTATGYSSASGTVQNDVPADITQSDFDSWDFDSIWEMTTGEWPTLEWQTAP